MRPDQERVKNLLTDTVTLLCKNGLQFCRELKVQGLLGITTDENDVFVVHIDQVFAGEKTKSAESQDDGAISSGLVDLTDGTEKHKPHRVRKRCSRDIDAGSPSGSAGNSLLDISPGSVQIKREEDETFGCSQQHSTEAQDDRNAMRETYSNLSLSDIKSGFEFETVAGGGVEVSGPPPIKRRSLPPASSSTSIPHGADSGGGGPFITGIVRLSDDNDPNIENNTSQSWDNAGLGQMPGDPSIAGMPGPSSWDPSQVPPGQDADDSVGTF